MRHETITSTANDAIKRLVRLRQRRHRDIEGVFVVEGLREIGAAIAAGLEPIEAFYNGDPPPIVARDLTPCSEAAMAKASYRSDPGATIAVFEQYRRTLDQVRLTDVPLVLIVEAVEKPGNLGAIVRTADAVGADVLIAADTRVDMFNPNVIRASTGAIFSVPTVEATLGEAHHWLQKAGLDLLAASPSGKEEMWETDMTGPVALMVGSEDSGLSQSAAELADVLVRIPMLGEADSLNVSVSMALLAYEALRQRAP